MSGSMKTKVISSPFNEPLDPEKKFWTAQAAWEGRGGALQLCHWIQGSSRFLIESSVNWGVISLQSGKALTHAFRKSFTALPDRIAMSNLSLFQLHT